MRPSLIPIRTAAVAGPQIPREVYFAELRANEFMGSLLVPRQHLRRAIEDLAGTHGVRLQHSPSLDPDLPGASLRLAAQEESVFPKRNIYFDGWNDLNKNGKKDVYEDSKASIESRVENLLSQMTLEEKTNQTATLYGYNRVLKDELPQPDWKNKIWKDGIANIDEHLNGWGQSGSSSVYANDIKKHVWAMNEVQRFFVEETRLGIPVDFTNEGVRGVADQAEAG